MSEGVEVPPPSWYDIPIVECGEPLVDLREVRALRLAPGLAGDPSRTLARAGVVDRLVMAQASLMDGLRLLVLSAFEPTGVAEPYADSHAAGAAMDLALCTRGGVPLGGDGDPHAGGPGGGTPLPLEYRLLMDEALRSAGFVGHPTAWRHWSYGDRRWALGTGARAARYRAIPVPPS